MADTKMDDDALLQPQLDLAQALAREQRAAEEQQHEYEARVHRLSAEYEEAMAQQKRRENEERARQQAARLQELADRQQPDREQRRQRVVAVIQEEPRPQQSHPALSGLVR